MASGDVVGRMAKETAVIPRTALVTEIPAPYRVAFLNALGSRMGKHIRVYFYGESERRRNWRLVAEGLHVPYEVVRGWLIQAAHGHPYFLNPGIVGALRRFSPQVIVLGSYAHPSAALVLGYAHLTETKTILWSESTAADGRGGGSLRERYKRWFIRNCRGFLVPGGAAREYVESLGADPSTVFVVPNAVDNRAFGRSAEEVAESATTRKAILFVGRIVRAKGVFDLVEAYASLSTLNRPPLWIVGDGPDREALDHFAKDRGIDGVQLFGAVPPENLPAIYGRAGIFVLPSWGEPWGMVLNEAAASGLPLIASLGAGGTREIVEPGVNGYWFRPRDAETLASLLGRLAYDPLLRQQMGEAARAKIEAFSPDTMTRRFVEGIERIASS
jgi:glycosyltransferase involved in cell wall biosynthesis